MVLAYHHITADSSYRYSLAPELFNAHVQRVADGSLPCLITFDDGHVSQYEAALPILEQHGCKATFFVTPGWTGKDRAYMTAAQLRELYRLGHRIESHSWSHPMLTHCSPGDLHQELHRSKSALEDILGAPVAAISAPHGRWNDAVATACRDAGYSDLYTSDHPAPAREDNGVRIIGRAMVTRSMSTEALNGVLRDRGQRDATSLVKGALKRILGDTLYRRVWRLLSAAGSEDLPTADCRRSPRVIHLISSGGYYGAESMIVNLTERLNRDGCPAGLAAFRNSQNPHTEIAERAAQRGIPAFVLDCRGQIDPATVREIRDALYRHGADILHTHGSKANMYGWLAARKLKVALVATYHMAWPDRDWRLYLYHLLDRFVLHAFRRIVVVSEPVGRSLVGAGLGDRKIIRIANGIDLKPFEQARRPRGDWEGRPVIGLVGRLTPAKGHVYLIEAARTILERYPNATFYFAGDGSERDRLGQLAESAGVAGNVTFAGNQSDMPAVYRSLDLLVLPSIVEGLPMTILEALASDLPVVASSVGDIPSVIRHEETGLLVPKADSRALAEAILDLLDHPAKALRMAAAGRALVEQDFNSEETARRYRAVYDAVCPHLVTGDIC